MKKRIFISNIIRAILILLLLIFVLIKNEQFSLRLIISSFMLMTICYIGKNVCILIHKPVGTKVFHKLFIIIFFLFGVGFLITWSYVWIKEKQYFPILFTIPLWVFEVYIFCKYLLGIKINPKEYKNQSKFVFKAIVSCLLVCGVLIIGIACLIIGIKDTYYTNKNTKGYLTTIGYYKDYEIYDSHKENHDTKTSTTYRLIYVYEIDGKEYSIKTDYGSGAIPSTISSREIRYNPNNPEEAVLLGTNRNNFLIYFGAFFLLGGMVFVLGFLYVLGAFDKIKVNILGLYVGIVCLIVGIGIIVFQFSELSSLIEVIKRMNFWIFIPTMFIVIGLFQIIKCLFFERLKMQSSKKLNK